MSHTICSVKSIFVHHLQLSLDSFIYQYFLKVWRFFPLKTTLRVQKMRRDIIVNMSAPIR